MKKFKNDLEYIGKSKAPDKSIVWNKDLIEDVLNKIKKGITIDQTKNPFFGKGDVKWRRGDIVYEYSNEELEEIKRNIKDPLHFAKNHAYLRTSKGNVLVDLRDYQENLIETYKNYKNTVVLSSRQMGKCVDYFTEITIRKDGVEKNVFIGDLFFDTLPKMNFLQKCKRFIYKLIKNIRYKYDKKFQLQCRISQGQSSN